MGSRRYGNKKQYLILPRKQRVRQTERYFLKDMQKLE